MSPVSGWPVTVHMGNFSPVDRGKIQETKPNWWNIKLVSFAAIVALCNSGLLYNFTNKANSHTPKVEIHARQKLCHFGCYAVKMKPFGLKIKVSSRLAGLECSYERIFIPVSEISITKTEISVAGSARLLISTHWNFLKERVAGKNSETEPARLTGLIWRVLRPMSRHFYRPVRLYVSSE